MFVENYFYTVGDTLVDDTYTISSIDRTREMTREYLNKFPQLLNMNTTGKTAVLYAGGPASHPSDVKSFDTSPNGGIVFKTQIGDNAYNVAKHYDNVDYVSINANTCASGMYSIYEAKDLLGDYDDVLIYAEEVIDDTLKLLFKQLGIKMLFGDAVCMLHLTAVRTPNTIAEIIDTAWVWNNDKSPMSVSAAGYIKALGGIDLRDVTVVKPHGTGTARNDIEEDSVISDLLPNAAVVKYKGEIGHTQGVSALVEVCMLLDDDRYTSGNAVCLASGLGGFYGVCKINK